MTVCVVVYFEERITASANNKMLHNARRILHDLRSEKSTPSVDVVENSLFDKSPPCQLRQALQGQVKYTGPSQLFFT